MPGGGLPHSEIVGSTLGSSSPTLIAAAHVLLRHSTPRHPPHACSSFFLCPPSCPRSLVLCSFSPSTRPHPSSHARGPGRCSRTPCRPFPRPQTYEEADPSTGMDRGYGAAAITMMPPPLGVRGRTTPARGLIFFSSLLDHAASPARLLTSFELVPRTTVRTACKGEH